MCLCYNVYNNITYIFKTRYEKLVLQAIFIYEL